MNGKRDHHSYDKIYIGDSDCAFLTLVGVKENHGAASSILNYGEDGDYYAYLVDEDTEIPESYEYIDHFVSWLKIYDDNGLTAEFSGKMIAVYRRGMRGTIIQVFK